MLPQLALVPESIWLPLRLQEYHQDHPNRVQDRYKCHDHQLREIRRLLNRKRALIGLRGQLGHDTLMSPVNSHSPRLRLER